MCEHKKSEELNRFTITKYGSRYFAVYDDGGKLIAVTVYRKGGEEIIRRLSECGRKIAAEVNGSTM